MDSPSMHGEAAGAPPVEQPKVDGRIPCGACPALFKPKKKWQRFCSAKCRTAFHTAEARTKAVQAAAPRMLAALQQIAAGADNPVAIAVAAIQGLQT